MSVGTSVGSSVEIAGPAGRAARVGAIPRALTRSLKRLPPNVGMWGYVPALEWKPTEPKIMNALTQDASCSALLLLDRRNQTVVTRQGRQQLTPKAYAVLELLYDRAGCLVTKDQLLDTVWPRVHVVEGVLKTVVGELRKTLGDDARTPDYIETVHRRGYRFIGVAAWPMTDRRAS